MHPTVGQMVRRVTVLAGALSGSVTKHRRISLCVTPRRLPPVSRWVRAALQENCHENERNCSGFDTISDVPGRSWRSVHR